MLFTLMKMADGSNCLPPLYFPVFCMPSLNSGLSRFWSLRSRRIWLTVFSIHPWNRCQGFGGSQGLQRQKHSPKRMTHCSPGLDNATQRRKAMKAFWWLRQNSLSTGGELWKTIFLGKLPLLPSSRDSPQIVGNDERWLRILSALEKRVFTSLNDVNSRSCR